MRLPTATDLPRALSRTTSGARPARFDSYLLAVVALTLVAFALRVALMRDSLLGDELFMFHIVHDRSLGQVLSVVRNTEKTPPLFFFLSWASAKIGDPTLWIRLPSVLFGTALVPLGYALARRTVGRAAGVVAAAILALDPYAIFYGTEARAYVAVAFLAALSTLCLLEAIRTGERRWWAGYALAVVAVLYTHYVGIFVVVAQAAWALWTHREHLRTQLVVYALIALACLPWLPSYLLQQKHSADEARRIALYSPASLHLFEAINGQALFGHPFVRLRELPGNAAVALAVAVIVLAALAAAVRAWRSRAADLRLSSPVALVALLAVASPAGVAVLSVRPGMSFMLARNLSPSIVPVALLVGWLLTSLGRRTAIAGIAAMLVVLTIGADRGFRASSRRTPYRSVAQFIDTRGRPGDPVIQQFILPTMGPLADVLRINLTHPYPIVQSQAGKAAAWALGLRGADVFLVQELPGFFKAVKHLPRFGGPGNKLVLVADHHYSGLSDVLVGEYRLPKSTVN